MRYKTRFCASDNHLIWVGNPNKDVHGLLGCLDFNHEVEPTGTSCCTIQTDNVGSELGYVYWQMSYYTPPNKFGWCDNGYQVSLCDPHHRCMVASETGHWGADWPWSDGPGSTCYVGVRCWGEGDTLPEYPELPEPPQEEPNWNLDGTAFTSWVKVKAPSLGKSSSLGMMYGPGVLRNPNFPNMAEPSEPVNGSIDVINAFGRGRHEFRLWFLDLEKRPPLIAEEDFFLDVGETKTVHVMGEGPHPYCFLLSAECFLSFWEKYGKMVAATGALAIGSGLVWWRK